MIRHFTTYFDLYKDNIPKNMHIIGTRFKSSTTKSTLLFIYKKILGEGISLMGFYYEIHKLSDVEKEHHDTFVEQVMKLNEYVDHKVVELKSEIAKDFEMMEENYALLHSKVNVVANAITKLVDLNTNYSYKVDAKLEKGYQVFTKLEEFLSCIKESISKADLSNQSLLS
ncbi:unnamed protein product [Lactuca saligna]|uniref:Uncharacterized protein n=1 Tax=Lactuca saligna TaxID=75948 RepID=A0AA35VHS8_LACSI|nr:unnamed protein product [Lactuca saligna]